MVDLACTAASYEQHVRVLELRKDGLSVGEIAKKVKLTGFIVKMILQRNELD